jgi:hypothetical protein
VRRLHYINQTFEKTRFKTKNSKEVMTINCKGQLIDLAKSDGVLNITLTLFLMEVSFQMR